MSRWTIIEDSGFTLLARIHGAGANLTQSDVTSLTYSIYKCHTDTALVSGTSLTVADVIFDTLQTNALLWTEDSTGYNFKHDVLHSVITDPAFRYEFEYKFTLSDANATEFIWMPDEPLTVRPVKTS